MSEAVVQGVVGVLERAGRLLAIRRAEGIRAAGWWCLPGGAVEAGESQPQAIIREMREELGLDVRPVRKIWEWQRPDGLLVLHWWQVETDDGSSAMKPEPAEVAEARFVSPAEFRCLEPVLESNLLFLEQYSPTCSPC